MLTDALSYLNNSDDAWKTTILGGIFLLFSFLLLPLFLVWGYIVRVVDRTAHGDEEAPTFEDWGEMLVDGAKVGLILLAYALVPAVVGTVLVGGILLATGGEPGVLGIGALTISALLTLAVAIAAMYVAPAGIANFAAERRLGAGIDLEALRPTLRTGTYASAWLIALGIVIVGGFVSGVLAPIPFLGPVLGALVSFYALVAAYSVIGRTWGELHPVTLEQDGTESTGERPAV
ncbi:DUF4013 domain-containing protein [Natronolimnobius baerhuensis]|uniref:DUF4013 domain-containing protein n=1 Tax=Natronolimnobius baerhuensis TaxID=253108 RepID=A0A202EBZ8_9EURY|nr:DUF4013 domain-containing protein [Natronolimnobius baerhuensis]OVE85765.1 hypothetical protein B2G88_02815 [Natronolimnobius baerhuensis]